MQSGDLLLVCPECKREFNSLMMFEWHIDLNAREKFLKVFAKVAKNEEDRGRGAGGSLMNMVNDRIKPTIQALVDRRRATPGIARNIIKDKTKRRAAIPQTPHTKDGKKK